MKIIISIFIVLFFTGCVQPQPFDWTSLAKVPQSVIASLVVNFSVVPLGTNYVVTCCFYDPQDESSTYA